MSNDPPPPTDGLGDLHRRRARGRPHPPNPRHEPERKTPISASETTHQHPTPQVSALHPIAPQTGDQTQVERHGGRTGTGVLVRVLQCILALTAAIWHSWTTGQPTLRSLIAYDH